MATARLKKYTQLSEDDYKDNSEDELNSDGEDQNDDDQGNNQEILLTLVLM